MIKNLPLSQRLDRLQLVQGNTLSQIKFNRIVKKIKLVDWELDIKMKAIQFLKERVLVAIKPTKESEMKQRINKKVKAKVKSILKASSVPKINSKSGKKIKFNSKRIKRTSDDSLTEESESSSEIETSH